MKGVSYLRSAAGLAPKDVPVLRPPRVPTWGLQVIPELGLSEPDAERLRRREPPLPERPAPGPSAAPTSLSTVSTPQPANAFTPSQTPSRLQPAESSAQRASVANATARENPVRPQLSPHGPEEQPYAPAKPVSPSPGWVEDRPRQFAEPRQALDPTGAVFLEQTHPETLAGDPHRQHAAALKPETPKLAGFAAFARAAGARPRLEAPAEPVLPPPAERSRMPESAKSDARPGNTVHIGSIDIRIVPAPEPPKPAPRPAAPASTAVLARGFPSWFGLRQG